MVTKPYLTGAHYGIISWVIQRITAVCILVLVTLFVIALFFIPSTFEGWHQFFTYTLTKIMVQLTFIAIAMHAWVGMRDIWMDYIKKPSVRLVFHVYALLWLVTSLMYSVSVIWRV